METCTYDLDHSAITATHYYRACEGDRVNLCFGCASRFGYPEYLVEHPKPWAPQYGYVAVVNEGFGDDELVANVIPLDERGVVRWFGELGCEDVRLLIADAAWEPYRPHYSEWDELTFEVTRVTCLPLV